MNELSCELLSLLRHSRMPLTVRLIFSGIISFLLVTHCQLTSGKPLHQSRSSSMCRDVRPCKHHVFDQIRCLVAHLNMSAQGLFEVYLRSQGPPFTDQKELDVFCEPDHMFPPFISPTREKKEMLITLYKVFVFFNASLDNITRDQEILQGDKEDLLRRLRNTTSSTRGLLANLTCLLCSEYKVSHVDVTYGKSSSTDTFAKKRQGCQVLRKYTKVISRAAQGLGHCHHKQT